MLSAQSEQTTIVLSGTDQLPLTEAPRRSSPAVYFECSATCICIAVQRVCSCDWCTPLHLKRQCIPSGLPLGPVAGLSVQAVLYAQGQGSACTNSAAHMFLRDSGHVK